MIKTGWRELTPSGQLGLLKSRQRNRESRADWETQTGNYSKLTEWIPDRDKENTVEQSKASVWDSFTAAGRFQPTVGELRKHCHTMWGEKTRTLWAARGRRRATLAEITIGWGLQCWEESAEDRRQHLHDSASGGNTILSSQHSVSIRYWQKPWSLIHTEVQKCSVYFSFCWVCAQGYDGHTCKSTCVCMWGVVYRSAGPPNICLRHFPTVLCTSCCTAGSVHQTQRWQTDDASQPTFPGIPVSLYRRLPHPPIFTQDLGIGMLGLICCGKCFTGQVISLYPCDRYFDF